MSGSVADMYVNLTHKRFALADEGGEKHGRPLAMARIKKIADGSGVRARLAHDKRSQETSRYGLLTMCESGGTANATIVERVGNAARQQIATLSRKALQLHSRIGPRPHRSVALSWRRALLASRSPGVPLQL